MISGLLSGESCRVAVRTPAAVDKVNFYLDGRLISTAVAAPYSCRINAERLSGGTHVLEARAYYADGETYSAYTFESIPWTSDPGTTVTVQGDSLTVGSWWRMAADLGPRFELTSVSAHFGRPSVTGVRDLRQQELGRVVVFALGTNDWWSTPARYREHLRAVMGMAGPKRCVVLATFWWQGHANSSLNRVLRSVARRYGPRRVQLAQWAAAVASHRVLTHDGTHPANPHSWDVRAQVVDSAIRACAARQAAPVSLGST